MIVKELADGYYLVVEEPDEKRRRYRPDPKEMRELADRIDDEIVKNRLMRVATLAESATASPAP